MEQEGGRPRGRKDAHPGRACKRQTFVEYQRATLTPNPVVAQPHPGAREKPFEEAELAKNPREFSLSTDQGERTTVSIALHERRMDSPVTRAPEVSAKYVAANPRDETKEEVGLRLLVPDGEMGQLQTTDIIARHARNGAVARQLEALYYDTADRALFTHGLSMRIQRSGDECIQILKRAPLEGRPTARSEWKTAVAGMAPNLTLMPTADIGPPLDRLSVDALRPIFVTKVLRRTRQLEFSGAVIEVAFNEGSIEAGEHCEPLREVELEMTSGDPQALYDIGVELLEVAPLRVSTQSNADRGYGLAYGLTPKTSNAKPPAITVDHTVDDVVGMLLGTCQHHLVANQPVAECGHDPEGVHQMRVALRRLRTACVLVCRVLGSSTAGFFGAEAKYLAQQLGAARDWDVFITQILSEPPKVLQSDILDFDALRQVAEAHRVTAYATLREMLASRRYNRFQLLLRSWIEGHGWRNELAGGSLPLLLDPAAEFAGGAMTRLHRKALKCGAHFGHLDTEARHQLRIALKKLRYTAELFHGLHHGSHAKNYLSCLSKLQDVLGRDNDGAMTQPFLRTLSLDITTPEVHQTIGAVMGWQARDRIATRPALRRRWQQFRVMQQFWSN
jgi:inorganic triphosphatase YgiF